MWRWLKWTDGYPQHSSPGLTHSLALLQVLLAITFSRRGLYHPHNLALWILAFYSNFCHSLFLGGVFRREPQCDDLLQRHAHTFFPVRITWCPFVPMVYYPFPGNTSTPQQRRPSEPTWSTRTPFTPSMSTFRTPSGGKQSNPRTTGSPRKRAEPYKKPENVRITLGPGKSCPMKLFTPKDHMDAVLRRKEASSTPSPIKTFTYLNTQGRARMPGKKLKTALYPPSLGVQDPSRTLVAPPMQGTSRRVERAPDPARPTVQLFKVMCKCWEDDTEKESDWTLTNALLNGRNEERDRRRIWDTLGYAVGNVWPKVRDWIMHHRPSDGDTAWFSSAGIISFNDEEYIRDPRLATKPSTIDRVGFHSS